MRMISDSDALALLDYRSTTSANCPITRALHIIGGKWRLLLVGQLMVSMRRYGELKSLIPEISEKMLIQELRALEAEGLVVRTQYAEVPPRVEYSLTEAGRALERVIAELLRWGLAHPPTGETVGDKAP